MIKRVFALGCFLFTAFSFAAPAKRLLVPTKLKDAKVCGAVAASAAVRLAATLKTAVTGSCDKFKEGDGSETLLLAFAFASKPPAWILSSVTAQTFVTELVTVSKSRVKLGYQPDQFVQYVETVSEQVPVTTLYGFSSIENCNTSLTSLLDASSIGFQGTSDCPNGECKAFAGYCLLNGNVFQFHVHRAHFYRHANALLARESASRSYRAPAQYEVMMTELFNSSICDTNRALATPRVEKFLGVKVTSFCKKYDPGNGNETYPMVFGLEKAVNGFTFSEKRVNPVTAVPKSKTVDITEYAYQGDTAIIEKNSFTKTVNYTEVVPVKFGDQIECDKEAQNVLAANAIAELKACDGVKCAPVAAYCGYTPETALYHYRFHFAHKP